MSTYVYGIIRATHPPLGRDLDGIGDPARPVRVLRRGELAALVSDAPEGLRPKRRDLLAHQRVLDEAGAGGVVLPMRFGSASPDDETVITVLAERAEDFLERLRALDGRAEYNIKANHDEEAVLRLIMADHDDIRSAAEANREAGGGNRPGRSGRRAGQPPRPRPAASPGPGPPGCPPPPAAAPGGPGGPGGPHTSQLPARTDPCWELCERCIECSRGTPFVAGTGFEPATSGL